MSTFKTKQQTAPLASTPPSLSPRRKLSALGHKHRHHKKLHHRPKDKDAEPLFTFPSLITSLGAVGTFALTAIPLAMVMVEHQIELSPLTMSTAWYVTSLLPRSIVLARLGSILLGLPAVLSALLFIGELVLVSMVEQTWATKENDTSCPWPGGPPPTMKMGAARYAEGADGEDAQGRVRWCCEPV